VNVGSRKVSGSVLAGGLFLLLAFFGSPAPEVKWIDLAGVWVTAGSLAGVLVLPLLGPTASLWSRAAQLALLGSALLGALELVHLELISGIAQLGFWLIVTSLGFAVWHVMQRFSQTDPKAPWLQLVFRIIVPAIFGVWFLALWELVTIGFGIPRVLLPSPGLVGNAITGSLNILAADFQQTVVPPLVPGFVIGNLAGFGCLPRTGGRF
jgi:hypothetical protein